MKKMYHLVTAISITTLLMSCSTGKTPTQVASNFINRQSIVHTTRDTYPAKNPQQVALYAGDKTPHTAYRVIGIAKISRYNLLGLKRQDIALENMMKSLAASIGGDGVIDIATNNDSMQANIIQFQRILI
ncbi:MAG: hypothetical protein A3F11_02650 [Gammaproteobacteria bacterium RIFCSPHIGHO2_12_FULL_37_14]|nr:MAG: hypothetical protein A3F11_02650 [Gammaproteobacteria bacterium RIFCSPHIGHO2_12_FULL_37_14]